MVTHWLAGFMMLSAGYQPRHRSTRRVREGAGEPQRYHGGVAWPAETTWDARWSASPATVPDQLDRLTSLEIRRLLDDCALDDLDVALPDLVRAVAHWSHTAATLSGAWDRFREATRDAYALHLGASRWQEFFQPEDLGCCPDEDALWIKLGQADYAWRLITTGVR
jgi:hypothetical protein